LWRSSAGGGPAAPVRFQRGKAVFDFIHASRQCRDSIRATGSSRW
jgi:hypothetical protein